MRKCIFANLVFGTLALASFPASFAKMAGMPAWGVTHSDELLWDVVAFLRKLPELTADQYQTLVKSAPKTHDEMMQEMEMGGGRY